MTQTTNYDLNIVEGSDVVNPLVQTNPNFQTIDSVMKANEGRGIATATEVKSGTNHAITRNIANAVFRFVATSDFRTGDTFSVDGTTVTATLASGELPKDRAYVVGTSVICILVDTRLTILNCEASMPTINADDVVFNPTGTDLTGDDVEEVIKEVNTKLNNAVIDLTDDIIIEFETETLDPSSLTPNVANTYTAPIPAKAGYTAIFTWFVGINSTVSWTDGITNIIPHSNGRNLAFTPSGGIGVLVTFAILYKKNN